MFGKISGEARSFWAMALNVSFMVVDGAPPGGQKPPVLHLVHGQRFDASVAPHLEWIRTLALRLTRSPADAADLVQDTLERALRAWERVQPDTNVRAWLATILNNLFIDRCRKQQSAGVPVPLDALTPLTPPAVAEAEPAWADLGEPEVREALAQVQPEFRAVFTLHLAGESYQAIADQLGIPKATVGTRLLRARRQLRDVLHARLKAGPHA